MLVRRMAREANKEGISNIDNTTQTCWRQLIGQKLSALDLTWSDVESCTLSSSKLDEEFNCSYGTKEGWPFTLWTETHVLFPAEYDGLEWVASVPRHPNGEATEHIGGEG